MVGCALFNWRNGSFGNLAPHRSSAGSAGASSIRSAGLSSNRNRATRQVSRLGLFSRLLLGNQLCSRQQIQPSSSRGPLVSSADPGRPGQHRAAP